MKKWLKQGIALLIGIIVPTLYSPALTAPLFTLEAIDSPTITIGPTSIANIRYRLCQKPTKKPHTVVFSLPKGLSVTPSCVDFLGASRLQCVDTAIHINGAALEGSIFGGPTVDQGNSAGCASSPSPSGSMPYMASGIHRLNVTYDPNLTASISINPTHIIMDTNTKSTLTITNDTSSFIPAEGIFATIAGTNTITINTATTMPCDSPLPPGMSCTIEFSSTDPQGPLPLNISTSNANTINTKIQVGTTITVNPIDLTISRNPLGAGVGDIVVNNIGHFDAINVAPQILPFGLIVTAPCVTPLAPNTSCTISYEATTDILPAASIPVQGSNTNTVNTTVSASQAILTLTSSRTLQALNSTYPDFPGGTPRALTLENTGTGDASNIVCPINLPAPISDATVNCSACQPNLPAGKSCSITISPGATSSGFTDGTLTEPMPSQLVISGANTNIVTSDILILTYGNFFKGGYIYAIDDTAPVNQNIAGGKVVTVANATSVLRWSPTMTFVGGINQNSTAGLNSCDGKSDGACNTSRIVSVFINPTDAPAAYYCNNLVENTFNDWYLPAVCELGASINQMFCQTPYFQNMADSIGGLLSPTFSNYWSSTEDSAINGAAWAVGLPSGIGALINKNSTTNVRCSRDFIT